MTRFSPPDDDLWEAMERSFAEEFELWEREQDEKFNEEFENAKERRD